MWTLVLNAELTHLSHHPPARPLPAVLKWVAVCVQLLYAYACVFCVLVLVMSQLKRQLLVLLSQTLQHSPFKATMNWGHCGCPDLFTASMNSIVSGFKLVLSRVLSASL